MNIKGENMKYLVHFHITEQGWAEIVDAKDNQDAKEKGIEMINKRSGLYSKALYEIKCDNLSKKEIVKKVLRIYETY